MKNRKGSIVNLSSVTGPMVADSGEVAYATTKSAILGFTKSLAAELVNDDIRVNAIMPGYIRTPMVDNTAKLSCPENPESVVNGIASAIPIAASTIPIITGIEPSALINSLSNIILNIKNILLKIKLT